MSSALALRDTQGGTAVSDDYRRLRVGVLINDHRERCLVVTRHDELLYGTVSVGAYMYPLSERSRLEGEVPS